MAVATETVEVHVLGISAGTPIPVAVPVFAAAEVKVYYGRDGLLAILNTDYTVALDDESNFDTFTLTPLASLLTKINALIALDPSEVNAIAIRRELNYLTDASPGNAYQTQYISNEFDRTVARFQQLADDLSRTLMFVRSFDGDIPKIRDAGAGKVLLVSEDGDFIDGGPTADQIEAAQGYAESAAQSVADIAELIGDVAVGDIAAAINAAPNKATPIDADKFGIWDSVSTAFRHVTLANLKTVLKSYFDTFYATAASVVNVLYSADIGVTVQGYDADTVKSDVNKNLTAGFTTSAVSDGTKSSGTYTPAPTTGNWRTATNNGAHTLAAPTTANDYTMIVDYTNGASAGTVTLSGFTKTTGDAMTTTNGHKFRLYVSKAALGVHLNIQAMQ